MTLSDWFALCGAISSTAAIVVALFIASSQERKNRKRIEEENKNIGETICALIEELNSLVSTLVIRGYQACIHQLEKDDTSQPDMKLVAMTGIKKLGEFTPDILYRVFRYYKLTGEDYRKFIISVDSVSSNVEFGLKNYRISSDRAVEYRNRLLKGYDEFNLMIFYVLRDYEKAQNTNDPFYTEIQQIREKFSIIKGSKDYNDIRDYKNEFVDKIQKYITPNIEANEEFISIYNKALEISTNYSTLQFSNKSYLEALQKTQGFIAGDMLVIMGAHDKLEKQCK